MGSRSTIEEAYIAGFLDGDGSLMLQLKKRKDGKNKFRFMATICFYQDTRHEKTLYWIRDYFGIGYTSRRRDGMTELRINAFGQVQIILKRLLPHIRFKKLQAEALYRAVGILSKETLRVLDEKKLREIVDLMLVIQNENYVTKRKRTKDEFFAIIGLTP